MVEPFKKDYSIDQKGDVYDHQICIIHIKQYVAPHQNYKS